MSDELKAAVKEFFKILDTQEESANGTVFYTTTISCTRVLHTRRLESLLAIMKEESK